MDPVTSIGAVVAWAWPVMASGVLSNAAYDVLKELLGERYSTYAKQGKEELFKEVLTGVLEQNQVLLEQLTALAAKHPVPANTVTKTIKGDINTGNVTAGGNVDIGHKIES